MLDLSMAVPLIAVVVAIIALLVLICPSVRIIGPNEVGLVTKRFGKKLPKDNVIAMQGEAGYQADLLMPGWHWRFWGVYTVRKFPWVQIPAGQIGVVIAQVGDSVPNGAKSAVYKETFGRFGDLRSFINNGGQKGVQRPVLEPGVCLPIHPVGFLVITKQKVFGLPVDEDMQDQALKPEDFDLDAGQLELVRIQPEGERDMIGIVTTFEGDPLESGDIASRLGGYSDIAEMIQQGKTDQEVIETLLGNKNSLHNNYQDFQKFLDNGGRIGLQHDPLMYGAYALNPYLVRVDKVPMLVIQQGQVAVIKSYVGLVPEDVSGSGYKHGSIVVPGRRGIWREPLRTGKYPINPRCYQAEIVPTAILTLNWANAQSQAHNLDSRLEQIIAKSQEGFIFKIDLQVQIHVPDTDAPLVISSVGSMSNLVNEVLQSAVGNHFRDKLQSMPAVDFIRQRQQVQEKAFELISEKLSEYKVVSKGVYIQDVVLPEELVKVLTQREIAAQEVETFRQQEAAERVRITMEKAKGEADMQAKLAGSQVNVTIATNNAEAQKAQADGEATYLEKTGTARGAEVRAIGLARAEAYEKQVAVLGPEGTALVNAITVLAEHGIAIVPQINAGGGGAGEGLAATLMGSLTGTLSLQKALAPVAPTQMLDPQATAEQEPETVQS